MATSLQVVGGWKGGQVEGAEMELTRVRVGEGRNDRGDDRGGMTGGRKT